MNRAVNIALLCWLLCLGAIGQEKDTTTYQWKAGIRHNGHIDFYKHPKIGLPGGPMMPPTSPLTSALRGQEHYYYEGLGLSKEHGFFTYRLWLDYFQYRRETNILYADTVLSDGYRQKASGFRFSLGLQKEGRWKFMGFSIGMELPVYFQTNKAISITLLNPNVPDEIFTQSQAYSNGLNTIGLSAFAGVNFYFLKTMSAGIELSNGFLYTRNRAYRETKDYYNAQGQLYKTEVRQYIPPPITKTKPRWFYLIPSVNLSYRL